VALFVNYSTTRPNRLTNGKDEKYHLDYARWTLESLNHPLWQKFITKTLVNWSFYKGGSGQWIFDEDLESFFLDESGDIRNRLKLSKNLVRPIVEQYVGNAIRLSYDAGAFPTSDFIINRREEELNRLKFFEQVEEAIPEFSSAIRKNVPLGQTPDETEELFEAGFEDDYVDTINDLITYIENEINIDEIKKRISKHIAISGIGIYKGFNQNNVYVGDAVDPLFFFFDLSARKPDLSDAEYMGEWYYADAPSLFEKYQNISKEARQQIEKYSANNSSNIHRIIEAHYSVGGAKVPVYESYWKDVEVQEYGWVNDEYGYPYFTLINHDDSDYTDKDLIEPPNESHAKVLNKKKKAKIYVDVLRYCIFTPKEEISHSEDVIYEFGEVPYQEKTKFDPSNVNFPYKPYCWNYNLGDIISPIDDAIHPQRMINRMLSVSESHVNNSRGSGSVIAKDAVDPRDGEESVMRNINKSKPIFVDTSRTGSVQNSVGTYDSNVGNGTLVMYNIMKELQLSLQDITGVNDSMTGTQGTKDALVGVVQSQIQRGSLVQEPFYFTLTEILKNAYQHFVNLGTRIYYDNPRRLAIMVGDKGMRTINITKDMKMEDFRVFIKRKEDENTERNSSNNMLITLLQLGLIDKERFSMLFNNANAHKISEAIRSYAKEEKLQQAKMADAQAANDEKANNEAINLEALQRDDNREMLDREDANKQKDRDADYEKSLMKEMAKNEREKMK